MGTDSGVSPFSALSPDAPAGVKTALIVAHPGHELRVFRWMETSQPIYFCITDGSGRDGQSRLGSTSQVLRKVCATQGGVFGPITDRNFYQYLLEGRHEIFTDLLKHLAEELIAQDITVVVGDSPEGMNPTHDVCRHLIDGAVAAAERITGRRIPNFEFALDAPPGSFDLKPEEQSQAVWLKLDETMLARKFEAASSYPELQGEIEEAMKLGGKESFAVECLVPSSGVASLRRFEQEVPAYERYGREGVVRHGKHFGRYKDVITFQQHVKPVVEAIHEASLAYTQPAGILGTGNV